MGVVVPQFSKGEQAVGDLVKLFDLRQPTISQHLRVLKEAGLVRVRPDAQRRLYSIDVKGFRPIELWLERHRRAWANRFDQLERYLDDEHATAEEAKE